VADTALMFPEEDPEEGQLGIPVDPVEQGRTVYATVTGWRTEERRPVFPAWMRNRQEARQLAGFLAQHGAHTLTFHSLRAPLYAARLVLYSPRGMWRAAKLVTDLVFDAEGRPLRAAAIERRDQDGYLKLLRERDHRVRTRGLPALLALALLGGGGVAASLTMPALAQAFLVLGVLVLGRLGAPPDRPLVASAVVRSGAAPVLRSDIVVRALKSCGIAAMNAKGADITFVAPITRDGPGYRAEVDLPYGVTATDVMEQREKLAGGLRRPTGCVWIEPAHHVHSGRLVLWVADQDMAKAKAQPWPLSRRGRVDLFEGFPVGTDQRGRTVSICLMFANMIIGAIPRMGKTFSLRLLLLAAALDPIAEVHAYDLKGTGDLAPLEPILHAYAAGDDEEDIRLALDEMRRLQQDLRRRTKVIRQLPRDLCPESKVTRELSERRSLGLHPVVVGVDECQRWFEHPEHGKELETICDDLVRRGPATGIVLILATQRVDAKSIPKTISSNAILRYCLKVMGHTENDMVLGTSAYKNGIRATLFTRSDRGIGWLSGEGDEPQILRFAYEDAPGAERIVARAHAARVAAGTLTGMAAGEERVPTPAADILEDLRVVFASCRVERIWSETACEHLAVIRPEVYGGWTPAMLAAALRPYQLLPGQVWADGANRNGYQLSELMEAMARRELER
jgi:S-DNA-T family DNA segregation ATPase FtsK/SpoIIIE